MLIPAALATVDRNHQHLLLILLQVGRQVEAEPYRVAFVLADVLPVEPHLAVAMYAVDL